MSEELLSALLDGECTPGELKRLLDEAAEAPALRGRWSRMCLVREAIEGTRVQHVAPDFCANIMAAIAREAQEPAAAPAKVVEFPAGRRGAPSQPRPARRRARSASRSWQPVAGLAAAASIVAVVAVGGYRMLNQPLDGAGTQVAAGTARVQPAVATEQVAAAPAAGQARLMPVAAVSSTAAAGDEPLQETRWSQLDADTARQLDEYMMEHSNLRATQGMGGALSYPRMTVRTAEYRTGERH
jgi:negative regulator of sigma E activity